MHLAKPSYTRQHLHQPVDPLFLKNMLVLFTSVSLGDVCYAELPTLLLTNTTGLLQVFKPSFF